MFAGITIPFGVIVLNTIFLMLGKSLYLLLTRGGQRAEQFSINNNLFVTIGVQMGLFFLLLGIEIVLNPHGLAWQDFVLRVAFCSTFTVPAFLLTRHHWRTSH